MANDLGQDASQRLHLHQGSMPVSHYLPPLFIITLSGTLPPATATKTRHQLSSLCFCAFMNTSQPGIVRLWDISRPFQFMILSSSQPQLTTPAASISRRSEKKPVTVAATMAAPLPSATPFPKSQRPTVLQNPHLVNPNP